MQITLICTSRIIAATRQDLRQQAVTRARA